MAPALDRVDEAARAPPLERPADLARHRAVLFRPRHHVSSWSLQGPDGAVTVEVRGPVETDDLGFVRRAVIAGAGVGLLPHYLFVRGEARVRRVLDGWSMASGAVHLVVEELRG